jgi:hypothetical protein
MPCETIEIEQQCQNWVAIHRDSRSSTILEARNLIRELMARLHEARRLQVEDTTWIAPAVAVVCPIFADSGAKTIERSLDELNGDHDMSVAASNFELCEVGS